MSKDRLTALDASFLQLEDESAHMHVASVMTFEGSAPPYDEFVRHTQSRLHLVPRYRQKLAFVPFGQARPRWVDDPHFNIGYHVRHTALPTPGSEDQLRHLAGRVFSQQLDRDKPLWETWLVEGLDGDGFAVLSKTHHSLVDGVSGADLLSVMFGPDEECDARPWQPRPMPSRSQLLAEALAERATAPIEAARTAASLLQSPRAAASSAVTALRGVAAMTLATLNPAPSSPYNVDIGPHRRFAWERASLADVKAIKNVLGGTVNDVMLTVVARALRRHVLRRGMEVDGLELKVMVPVSVRPDSDRGALGNQVAAIMAPLPLGCSEPETCLSRISASMRSVKDSGQAVGAQVLTELSGFAPPTIAAQAARLPGQRFFNLVVTNVPGPQSPLHMLDRQMKDIFPMVPLAPGQGLGVAIMSYNGTINFGLVGDYDALFDLDELAGDFSAALRELADVAGVRLERGGRATGRLDRGSESRRAPATPSSAPASLGRS